jgi:hypothetical protein
MNGMLSVMVLFGVLALSLFLSFIQIIFLTDMLIKKMTFFLRCTCAVVFLEGSVIGFGALSGLFRFNLQTIPFFLTIFAAVFLLSVLLISKAQNKGYVRPAELLKAAWLALKKNAVLYLSALIIGMAAGYRGPKELSRPWQLPETSITELLDRPDRDEPSAEKNE